MPFAKKYQPKSLKEVIGQDTAIKKIHDFIANFKKSRKRALILYGPSGSGKTSSVYAVASQFNLEVFELNSSDFRNQEQVNTRLGSALKQRSLFYQGKIILVDEIDGLSGREDRGGVSALAKLIEETTYPIIMTSNNPYEDKLKTLRNKAELVQFNDLDFISIFSVLKKVSDHEKIHYEEETLKSLARRSAGDLRGALNDLETLAYNNKLTKEELDELGDRNKVDTILNALVKIFKGKDLNVAITAFDNVEEDLDKVILWVDENLAKEYKGKDLAEAYDRLSKADVFRGRIRRWQHYRFLIYVNALVSAGIAASKEEKSKTFVQYGPTTRLLKIWQANMKYAKRKEIARKIAAKTHSGAKETIKLMPYYQVLFKRNSHLRTEMTKEFDLNKEEIEWLKK